MKLNTTLLIIITLIAAAGAYWYFFTRTGNQPPLSASTSASVNQAQLQFETLVGELQSISFNTSIFSDPRFNALVDIAISISSEPAGRPDPLAPIPGVSGH